MSLRTKRLVFSILLIAIYLMLGMVSEVGRYIQLVISGAAFGWVLRDVVNAIIKE